MSRHATISLVNYKPVPGEDPARLAKTVELMGTHVDQAAAAGSDLVAFPETCNTVGSAGHYLFEPLDGPTVAAMCKKAKERGIYVVPSLFLEEDGKDRISSVLIGRDGGIAGVYHKNFLTEAGLSRGIMPGTARPVFETDFGRVGLCICFDLNYHEVGAGLCDNGAELVIWSSMWPGKRMLTKWAIEFGFQIGACYFDQSTFVDVAGRQIINIARNISDAAGGAPLVTATLDLDRRLLHPNFNLDRLRPLYEKYGPTAAYAEHLEEEGALVFGSQLPDVSSDELIEEFGLEPMRDYLARVRRDRQRALDGTYKQGTP